MTATEPIGTTPTDETAVARVRALFRAEGYRSRIVERGPNRYVRVTGDDTDGLVWVRDAGHDSDDGLAGFCIDCDRHGVAERYVVSTAGDDAVVSHAASLGIEFVGPETLEDALRSAGHVTTPETPEETDREGKSERVERRVDGAGETDGSRSRLRSVTERIRRRVVSPTVR